MVGKYRLSDLGSMRQENSMLEERLRGRKLKQELEAARKPVVQQQSSSSSSTSGYGAWGQSSTPMAYGSSEAREEARQRENDLARERENDARKAMMLRREDDDYTREKSLDARDREFKSRQDAMEQASVRQRTREKTDAGAAWNAALGR